ncbi:MAG: Clp protease ClpP [Desulfobacterales bacterium]|nr:Clp protease ClpP [Desulfobacterales bacterium]
MKLTYRTRAVAKAVSGIYQRPLDQKFDWYEIKAQADDEVEMLVYDYIGWPFNDAGELVRSIAGMRGKKITVRINSPGGDVFDAMAIYNAFTGHDSKVTTRAEALAASSASIILLAGKEVQAYQNAMLMIHEPWAFIAGNQWDMREMAELLGKINENMVDIYSQQSKAGKKEIRQMLKDETWMTAKEAKEKGFIDTILDGKAAAKASFDLSMFANLPDELRPAEGDEPTIRDAERALRDAGFSQGKAKAVLSRGWPKAEGENQFSEIKTLLSESLEIWR